MKQFFPGRSMAIAVGVLAIFLFFSLSAFAQASCSQNREVCRTQSDCTAQSYYWCAETSSCVPSSGDCSSYDVDNCHSANKGNCYTKEGCEQYTGYWCQASATIFYCVNDSSLCGSQCSSSSLSTCYSQSSCESAGGQWYGGQCIGACNSSNYFNCKTDSVCTQQGGKWCTDKSYCYADSNSSACPGASSGTSGSSNNNSSTTNSSSTSNSSGTRTGSYPCDDGKTFVTSTGKCVDSKCAENNEVCRSEADCSGKGFYWCFKTNSCVSSAGDCSDYDVDNCHSKNKGNCYTQGGCEQYSGFWCETGVNRYACADNLLLCPQCSSERLYECFNSNSCESAGGQWFEDRCIAQCTRDSFFECKSESSCYRIGGRWCAETSSCYSDSNSSGCPSYRSNNQQDNDSGNDSLVSREKLVDIVLKLEVMDVSFNEIKNVLRGLYNYWDGYGNVEKAENFSKAISIVEKMQDKISAVRQKISDNFDSFDQKLLAEVRKDLESIRGDIGELIKAILGV